MDTLSMQVCALVRPSYVYVILITDTKEKMIFNINKFPPVNQKYR